MNDKTWEDIRAELRGALPAHTYRSFVEPAKLEELAENRLTLGFSSTFAKENFEQKCLPILQKILHEGTYEAKEVSLAIKKNQAAEQINRVTVATVDEHPRFDSKYSFHSFVVGNTNQFAHAACHAVSKQPGQCYNPLFIFGGAGLGKTHLLKAVGNAALQSNRDLKAIYVTTETFTNELIHAIRMDKMREFREKYRSGCDVLLIDDVHFLAGKERTQEEFFYTFNYLHELRKQIVITSDRYPKDIQGLEARLQTRFEWGLVADIQPPEMETRVAILKNKAESESIVLPDTVAEFVATHVKNNIRELEGALHRLQAYASLTGASISLELAHHIFKDIAPKVKHEITPEGILKTVALHFNVRTTDLKSDKRIRRLSFPRQVCMYLMRKYLPLSFPEIGRIMGGKDHTTILHGVTRIAEKLRTETETIKHITTLEGLLR